eukprot:11736930-Ditylum_brightwellii.AAC.1
MCNKKNETNKLDHNSKANQNKQSKENIATEESKEDKSNGDNAPTDIEEVNIINSLNMEKNKRDHPASSIKEGKSPAITSIIKNHTHMVKINSNDNEHSSPIDITTISTEEITAMAEETNSSTLKVVPSKKRQILLPDRNMEDAE